jgi:hypothetical protein
MANLSRARMFHTDLSRATLTKATLQGADLRCVNLQDARLREADLSRVDFTGADLRSVDLSKSSVPGSSFNNTDLRNARLRAITGFEKAEWTGTDIRDINFSAAYRLRRFIVDQNYLREFRESSRFNEFAYYVWWVTSDCGRSLTRWCVWISLVIVLFSWLYSFTGINYGANRDWIAPLYYSVVTLSTLGYGDIAPVTPVARILAMIEVMIGYLMLGGLLSIFNNKMARRGE